MAGRPGQRLQRLGQLGAVATGHLDVQQHQIAGAVCARAASALRLQPLQRLCRTGCLSDDGGAWRGAVIDQRTQPQPRQCLIVDQQHAQFPVGRWSRVHSGTTICTR